VTLVVPVVSNHLPPRHRSLLSSLAGLSHTITRPDDVLKAPTSRDQGGKGSEWPSVVSRRSVHQTRWKRGVRYRKCKAHFGPFRFSVPDPVFPADPES
jgi:hypothetical protein